jgi:hypothetical protein
MGHDDGSVQARYEHIRAGMVTRLLEGLPGLWAGALAARRQLSAGSPVAARDRLLRQEAEK